MPTHGSKWCIITKNCTSQIFLILYKEMLSFLLFFFEQKAVFSFETPPFSSSLLSCFFDQSSSSSISCNRQQTYPHSHFKCGSSQSLICSCTLIHLLSFFPYLLLRSRTRDGCFPRNRQIIFL